MPGLGKSLKMLQNITDVFNGFFSIFSMAAAGIGKEITTSLALSFLQITIAVYSSVDGILDRALVSTFDLPILSILST